MADTKISELPVTNTIASPDVVPVVRAGVTMQADVSLFGSSTASLILHSSGDRLANQSSGLLQVGEQYTILLYTASDDFTNVGAGSNATGIIFTATGTTPSDWSNGSKLTNRPYTPQNSGIIVKDVNGDEVFRLWGDTGGDPGTPGSPQASLFLGLGAGFNTVCHDGCANTAVGAHALQKNTTGGFNTALGTWSLDHNTEGGSNTAVGFSSLENTETGSFNTAIGEEAGPDGSDQASLNNTVTVGGLAKVTGDDGIAIGFNATAAENAIAIGANTNANGANSCQIGDSNVATFSFGGSGVYINALGIGGNAQLIFPDSDPHIAGAGYWLAGVLTRSSG